MITRNLYLSRIAPFIGTSLIKVLIGQRRVGKSVLLRQIKSFIETHSPDTTTVFVTTELMEFSFLRTAEDLYTYVESQINPAGPNALFIDEIQDISNFERVLRDYCARPNMDIYITGSNSRLLSGELATFLGGRYVEFKVFGLSYSEFLQFHGLDDTHSSFLNYAKRGGLPYLIHLPDHDQVVGEYHRSLFNSILLKDIVARFGVRNVTFLEALTHYAANHIGSIVSAKKISDFLRSQRQNIATQTVLDYLKFMEAAQFIHRVNRTDIRSKKVFEIGEKYYFEDTGIRNALVGYRTDDIGKLLENIVYHHLRIAGYDVEVAVDGPREVDFVATRNGEKIYVQVAYLLHDEETRQREFGNLLAIPDHYRKYVVTLDQTGETNTYLGIHRMHAADFCRMLVA